MLLFRRLGGPLAPLLALLLALLGAAAPAGAAPARTLRFEQLSVEHGLAQETVLSIAQDRQGFMWFGSQAGLSRYDGYRVVTYKSSGSDSRSLAADWVRALHVDPSGQLWVGTDGGLDRYDPLSHDFSHFVPHDAGKRGNGNRHVRAIVDDGARGLWIATADGLQHLDPGTGRFTLWHHDPARPGSLGDNVINALARDGAGRLWVGTASGLDMLAPGAAEFEHFAPEPTPGSKFNAVQALLVDADQQLWIGSLGGIERWRLDRTPGGAPQRSRLGPREGLKEGHIGALYQDGDGTVWVGSNADGLYRWMPRQQRFVQYRHHDSDKHSVADNQVSALFRDRVGTFWVGTWYNGVSRVDLGSGGFSHFAKAADAPHSLSDNKVRALAEAGAGRVWVGTNRGLNLFDPASGAAEVFGLNPNVPAALRDEQVTALWRGKGDVLWVGGRTGLHRMDTASKRFSTLWFARGDPASDIIRGIVADRAGMLWVSSRGGLHRLDPDTRAFQSYRHDPADSTSLADNVVRPVLEDSRGALWVGTFNGLDLLDRRTGRFRHFRHDPRDPASLSHDEVHALFEDGDGNVWVGTAYGLNRMKMGADGVPRFRRYLRRDGMADDAIASILADGKGGLWLSTNSGISHLDIASGRFRNFDSSDGTAEGAFFDGSALRGADGTLYFGGFSGVTAFTPQAIRNNGVAPAVAITAFQILNQPVEAGRGAYPHVLSGAIERSAALTLGDQDAVFSLEFAALHYAAPQRNRYAYRLEGFDRDWVATDASKRFATYTNLDPGQYVFRVKAANKDGLWNDEGATLAITILPPYWKTWWFRALLALLLLGAACAAYMARMRGVRAQKTWLERQVSARTAEVEQKNSLLQQQEKRVRLQSGELALANRALQDNDERLRQAKQKAEDATRQKSEFLANMSHEMRTPLAGVIGMLGFALRDQQLQEGTRAQILRGQANAQSLLAIINDLLDFSKIEAGKLSIENIDFALGAAIENVVSLFEEQAAARSVGFTIDFAPDLPTFVVGDPTRLRQVLVNLVGNAFKFTQSGAVGVRVERAGSAPGPRGRGVNLIRFSVRDSGIGIEQEALPRLFQQFEQADSTTTRRYGGTGLGLAICRQLVELMDGQISAESAPGVGSTFSFVVPLADGVAPPLLPQVARAPHSHQLRVLCAEDFPTNQIIIRVLLEDLGHRVDVVVNGALAVAACARTRYDLILMDGRMPEMDGASATRLIRAGGPAEAPVRDQEMLIIALTANASEEDRSRYLGAGMDDFLTKPIDEAALHFQLGRAIERQLQRGFMLPLMPARGAAPSAAELDAMFGVAAETAPAPPARGGELKRRLRDAFAADVDGRLGALDAALAACDSEAAGRLLHGLKGSAAYLDEIELHLLCSELEEAADAAEWAALRAAMPRLRDLLGRIR
ncbi:two-component regulator propeller domain-containing protein [Janthinobacterium fluminis]|uniref:histidine kinase n=1 Tax=Janthinobacterium fluminis TaxID=2987524 RepID=A0ABT5JZV1_9BURK|nr:two-component regulator propeller domain-containing protein [Janthinobacterium fluminis]MDC8757586.1 two-component regulator propeller domain-containing protein [Janthinobacterium fluminis]